MTTPEAAFKEAHDAYTNAAVRLSTELERRIARKVRAVFPTATTLHTYGETTEDGVDIVRAQRVTDATDAIVAGRGPGSEVVEHNDYSWDDLTDEVDPDLDWLGDLSGDEYRGSSAILLDLVEEPPPSVLLVVDGVATCPRCGGTDFRYEESYPTTRTMDDNADGVLRFDGSFDWTEGNSTPGIVCENVVGGGTEAARRGVSIRNAFRECGAELTTPDTGLELAWS